jgi:hypothetical protein
MTTVSTRRCVKQETEKNREEEEDEEEVRETGTSVYLKH